LYLDPGFLAYLADQAETAGLRVTVKITAGVQYDEVIAIKKGERMRTPSTG